MPGSDDLLYQPAQKTSSFQAQSLKKSKNVKSLLLFFIAVIGSLAVFVAFFLILNFFNLVSLSKIYPNQLGFLPHLSQTANGMPAINKQRSVTTDDSQAPIMTNFAKLQNQASNTQMQKYKSFAAGFAKPTAQGDAINYAGGAVFSGYDSFTIQVVTRDSVLNLNFDQNTVFEKYQQPNTQIGSTTVSKTFPKPIVYTSGDFFKNVPFGSLLQIHFSKPDLKATQVEYLDFIKPVF